MARAGRIFWSRIKIAVDVGETFPIFVFFKNISVIIKKKKGHAHEIYSAATWMKATNIIE